MYFTFKKEKDLASTTSSSAVNSTMIVILTLYILLSKVTCFLEQLQVEPTMLVSWKVGSEFIGGMDDSLFFL